MALYLMSEAERLRAECWGIFRETPARRGMYDINPQRDRMEAKADRLWEDAAALIKQAKPILRAIGKIEAQTAAGVYAKALIVRGSSTGAEHLARSLARDLTAQPALRASLWPAGAAQ